MKLTLCGSARFEQTFHEWNEKLTLSGHVVYGLAVYPSFHEGNKDWYTPDQKTMLDKVHFKKIDNSDGIIVLNLDGYVGTSTMNEIKHAVKRDAEVFWLEYPGPLLLHDLSWPTHIQYAQSLVQEPN